MSKLRSGSHSSMALLLQLAAIVLTALSLVNGAKIDIINNCHEVTTACAAHGSSPTTCYVLNSGGGKKTLDVGSKWEGGLIWAFPSNSGNSALGIQAKPQANLAEITINGFSNQDSYDISNVNAYNLPMKIAVTQIAGGGTPSGTHCTPIECNIPYNTLANFCQAPNKLTGPPGKGCYNVDGPGKVSTAGTRQFKAKCPNAYSYSLDDAHNPPVVNGCNTGSNYEVVFCPSGSLKSSEAVA